MQQTTYALLWIGLTFVMANLPFVFFGHNRRRHLVWVFLALAAGYAMAISVGMWIESYLGKTTTQGWQFYGVTVALYLTFASVGFVWRYLYVRRPA